MLNQNIDHLEQILSKFFDFLNDDSFEVGANWMRDQLNQLGYKLK